MTEGKRYYIMVHAYHHVVAEVAEVLGPSRYMIKNVVWVYSSRRGWSEFFRDGFADGDVYHHFPDGEISGNFAAFDWNHPIPERPTRGTPRR